MPNMSTHVDKVYLQDPSIEWDYHMCQNRRVLLARDYDFTTVLSYIPLKFVLVLRYLKFVEMVI